MGERSRRRRRFVEAGGLLLIAVGVMVDSLGYPPPLGEGVPGPAVFPRLVAALLIGCAVFLLLRARRGRAAAEASGSGGLRVWAAAGAIAGFLGLLPMVGTVVALPPLVGGLLWLAGERSRVILAAVPLAFAGFVHLLFRVVLGVPLP